MENKHYRSLRRSSDFDLIRKQGRKVATSKWMAFAYRANESEQNRWGWTVSSKVGSSVLRNRLKRWCRESAQKIEKLQSSRQTKKAKDINVIFRPINNQFYRNLSYEEFDHVFVSTWTQLP